MRSTYIVGLVVAVAVLLAGAAWYTKDTRDDAKNIENSTFGTYAYTCDSGVEFLMQPSADFRSLSIAPVIGLNYPRPSTLHESPTDTWYRFRSADYELHGQGETVTLYDIGTQKKYTCEPQPKPDEPPINFGD